MKLFVRFLCISTMCLILTLGLASCAKDPSAKPKVYTYSVGDPFVTNLKDSKKMLKCSVVFEVTKKSIADKSSDTNYMIRNAVNTMLLQLTEADVLNITDTKLIEQKMTDVANEAMETDVFYSAKITDFTAA